MYMYIQTILWTVIINLIYSGPRLIKSWNWSQLICDRYKLQLCTLEIGDCKLVVNRRISNWFGLIAALYKDGAKDWYDIAKNCSVFL